MKISVALCTYNGSKYLAEQLHSITVQIRLPDEVVICDDASLDDSVRLAYSFASRASFPVRVFTANQNQGSTKNFERAISLCSGDVIVLSDQDDVWMPHKIEAIVAAFTLHPRLAMSFSDAIVTNAEMVPLHRLWRSSGVGSARRKQILRGDAFPELLKGNFVTGATMAFAARVRDVALPIPILRSHIHDAWLALVAAALGSVEPITEPGIYYRQHQRQQLGELKSDLVSDFFAKLDFETRLAYVHRVEDLMQLESRLNLYRVQLPDSKSLWHLQQQRKHGLMRGGIPRSRLLRVPLVLREAISGRYKYSSGWRSVLRDLLLN